MTRPRPLVLDGVKAIISAVAALLDQSVIARRDTYKDARCRLLRSRSFLQPRQPRQADIPCRMGPGELGLLAKVSAQPLVVKGRRAPRKGCELFRAWLIDLMKLVCEEGPSGLPLSEIATQTDRRVGPLGPPFGCWRR